MAINVGDGILRILGDTSELDKSLNGLKGKMSGFGKALGAGLLTIGTAAVGAGVASVKSFADAGSEIYDMSKRTGVGTKALSEYKYMADQTGASLGAVETALKRMAATITEASQGSGEQVEALSSLNLSIEELLGLSPEEQFNKITTAIADIEDPTLRAGAAIDIFGRSGTDLLSMLSEGGAGMDTMREKAAELGVVFTEETAAQADVLGDALTDVQKSMQGVMNEIATALAPTITVLAQEVVKLVKELPLEQISELISSLLPPLIDLILQIIEAIPMDVLIELVNTILKPVLEILQALMPILEPILFLVSKLLQILTPVLDILGRVLSFIVQILSSGIMAVLTGITSLFGGGSATKFSLPSFQGFEGVVPGIPGTPRLAVIHAGEEIHQPGSSRWEGITNNFSIGELVVREQADIYRIAKELYSLQRTTGRQLGVV